MTFHKDNSPMILLEIIRLFFHFQDEIRGSL